MLPATRSTSSQPLMLQPSWRFRASEISDISCTHPGWNWAWVRVGGVGGWVGGWRGNGVGQVGAGGYWIGLHSRLPRGGLCVGSSAGQQAPRSWPAAQQPSTPRDGTARRAASEQVAARQRHASQALALRHGQQHAAVRARAHPPAGPPAARRGCPSRRLVQGEERGGRVATRVSCCCGSDWGRTVLFQRMLFQRMLLQRMLLNLLGNRQGRDPGELTGGSAPVRSNGRHNGVPAHPPDGAAQGTRHKAQGTRH